MKKLSLLLLLYLLMGDLCYGQNLNQNINQNVNQNVNQNSIIINNLPVIEKKEYIVKYRPVYIEKKQPRRIARKLPAPICLLGFLWVFPEDLGTYDGNPNGIISQINRQGLHGRNDWRVPTADELQLMENYADKCGLGDDIYLSTSHRNGILRLVSTGLSILEQRKQMAAEKARQEREDAYRAAQEAAARQALIDQQAAARQALIDQQAAAHQALIDQQNNLVARGEGFWANSLLWAATNVGSNASYDKGVAYSKVNCPENWRLPTETEFRTLLRQSKKYSSYYVHSSGLVIPFGVYAIQGNDDKKYIMLPNLMVGSGSGLKFIRVVQDKIY